MTVEKIARDVRREIDDILAERGDSEAHEKFWRRFEAKINNAWTKNQNDTPYFPICHGCKNRIKTSSFYVGKEDENKYCNNCAYTKYPGQKYITKSRQKRFRTKSRRKSRSRKKKKP